MRKIISVITSLLVLVSAYPIVNAAEPENLFFEDFTYDIVDKTVDNVTYSVKNPGRGSSIVSDGKLKMSSNTEQASDNYYMAVSSVDNEKWKTEEDNGQITVKFQIDANTNFVGIGGHFVTSDAESALKEALADEYNYGIDNKKGQYRTEGGSQSYVKIYKDKIIVFEEKIETGVAIGEEHTLRLSISGDNKYSIYLDGTALKENDEIDNFSVRYQYKNKSDSTRDQHLVNKTFFRGFREIWLQLYANKEATSPKNCLPCTVCFDDLRLERTVREELPTVYIDGYKGANEIELDYDEIVPFSIIAQSETLDILKLTYSVDGGDEKELSKPYSFDAASLGVGSFSLKLTAENTGGFTSSYIVNLKISKVLKKPLWTETFDGYSLSSSSNGITFTQSDSNEAYARVENAFEGDGIVFGMDSSKRGEKTAAVNQYMTVAAGSIKTARISFDVMIDKKPQINDKRYYTVVLRDDSSKGSYTASNIQCQKIIWRDKLYVGSSSVDYEENKWYSLVVDIDMAPNECRVTLIDKESGEKVPAGSFTAESDTEKLKEVDLIRLHSRRDEIKADSDIYTTGNISIDNFAMTTLSSAPVIMSVAPVDYDDKTIEFTVSERLLASSVNAGNISLDGEEGKIKIEQVSYREETKNVILTLAENLRSVSNYTIKLSKDVCVEADIPFGADVIKEFTTQPRNIEFLNLDFKNGKMSVSAENFGGEKSFVMIVSIWDGTEFVKSFAKECSISDASGTFELDADELKNGQRAELYIWDSIDNKKMLINKVY